MLRVLGRGLRRRALPMRAAPARLRSAPLTASGIRLNLGTAQRAQLSTTTSAASKPTSNIATSAAASAAAAATAAPSDPLALRNAYNLKAANGAALQSLASELAGSDVSSWNVVLYQYQTCPYCNKVRAFLDFHRIPYRVEEVNPMTKRKALAFTSGYDRVPLATVRGVPIGDSSDIISFLYRALPAASTAAAAAVNGGRREVTAEVTQWRAWADDHLLHLFPPNIYQTMGESFSSFDYMAEASSMSWGQRLLSKAVGGVAMYFVAKRNLKKYAIKQPRSELFAAVNAWTNAIPEAARFHGGATPDLADVTVFGALRSLKGFRVGEELAPNTAPRFSAWYAAMTTATGASARTNKLAQPTRFAETATAAAPAADK